MKHYEFSDDRRQYARTACNIQVTIYTEDNQEFTGTILDLSETGMRIETSIRLADHISNEITHLKIQFLDQLKIENSWIENIVTEEATIRHIEHNDGQLYIGLYILSESFREYIRLRDTSNFYKKLIKNRSSKNFNIEDTCICT